MFTIDSVLTRNEAVVLLTTMLIGESIFTSAEARRLRDRVGHRLDYALTESKHFPTSRPDRIVFGELGVWARSKRGWSAKLSGLRVEKFVAGGHGAFSPTGRVGNFPKDSADCHKEIDRLLDLIDALQRENVKLKHENAKLAVPAEMWQELIKRNTENARKRRKV